MTTASMTRAVPPASRSVYPRLWSSRSSEEGGERRLHCIVQDEDRRLDRPVRPRAQGVASARAEQHRIRDADERELTREDAAHTGSGEGRRRLEAANRAHSGREHHHRERAEIRVGGDGDGAIARR